MHLELKRRARSRWTMAALILVCFATAWSGCGDRPEFYENPVAISDPIVVGRSLVYLDQTRERLTILRPYEGEVRHVDLGRRPSYMRPTPDNERLMVICKGWLATTADETDEEPSLYIVDPGTGDSEIVPLGTPYDRVSASDDNRFVVAYFSADADPSETEVFRNPNSVAIIDLESGEMTEKSVRSFGDVPRGVTFSPSTMASIGPDGRLGEQRTLAVVFATGYVTLLDVNHPERREVTVRLTLPGSSASLNPSSRMVFAPSAGAIYLRATGSNDVYVLTLTTRETSSADENDFVVSINTLAAGSAPADVALFQDGDRQLVLVANVGSDDVTVIDALTAEFFNIPVGAPIDRIVTYPAEDPEVALLYSHATKTNSVYFLDLEDIEARRGRNLTPLSGGELVTGMELIPSRPLALVTHDHAQSVMSVLDLEEQTLTPFTGHSNLGDYALTSDGRVLAGFSADRQTLGVIDLDTLAARAIALDHAPRSVLTLAPEEGAATDPELRTVVIVHDDPLGMITVVTDPLTGRGSGSFVMSGFLHENLFDERHED